ncbi:SGNH hydrolase-type esterase domain-containing protein [Xylaria sp. FL1777]|nr:SGNH hydrolase-type esterase domain-containing protein [Xylaria sp. FL1777]
MARSQLSPQPTVNRRWNARSDFITLFLVVSSFWFSVAKAAILPTRTLQRRDTIGGGVDLRVLPIGDSITWGAQSSDDNGYRLTLHEKLTARGNDVNFVGSVSSGTFLDDQHEGHRGYLIDEINSASDLGIYAAPNIVLLHAGTNDMYHDSNVGNAPTRLENLINKIYSHSPKAAVFVCQIIPSKTGSIQARINDFNDAIPSVVAKYVDAGKHVTMVSMNEALSTSDLADFLHPNDGGYVKMANAYYAAIQEADDKGWIVEPGEAQTPPSSTSPDSCRASPSWYKIGQIATGAKVATTDGDFKPAWVKKGVVAEGACPRAQLHFMDLDGDGLKDYACVDPDTGATDVWLNIPDADGKTSGNWNKLGEIATGRKGRHGTGVLFADLNGDGRDDYIYVDPDDGEVYAWINRLEKDGVWQWQDIGRIAGGVGATNKTLQMVDIDGDGRDDFCLVNQSTGEVTAWLNTGADVVPDYYKLGVIATGGSASKGDTVFLGDLTGEGRADYMIVGDGGKVNGLINRLQATTLAPRWLAAFTFAEGPDGAEQDQVRLVDMTGDGKVDYLLVDEKTGKVTLWENLGTGGKYQPGEGVVLCDLDGDGTSDYFWLDENGRGWGYLNIGKGRNVWNDLGQIANGPVRDRNTIRMGVLTHSGRADYIMVDDDTGRALWWQNLGPDSGWGWASRGEAATGPRATIENTYGWKFRGRNVRFADLDGDGFDDYLYVNDLGAVVMWKNLGTNPITWGLHHLVADGVGVLARQVQFADTNGDGLLDYNVVGSVTGGTRSWHNLGFRDDGSIRWNTPLSFADGTGPGFTIKIAEASMTGDKRADYVAINPDNGALTLWQNRCNPIDTIPTDTPPVETFPGDGDGDGDGDGGAGTGDGDGGAGTGDGDDGGAGTGPPTTVTVHFSDDSCGSDEAVITTEMSWAYAMAKAAADEPANSDYYEHFFSEGLRENDAFAAKIAARYEYMANMLSGTSDGYKVGVTCDNTTKFCSQGYLAHMNDGKKRMNFCKLFFKTEPKPGKISDYTETALGKCSSGDLRYFQRTKSSIIVHETAHTKYAMGGTQKSYDYAYGYQHCTELATGDFNRGCGSYAGKILCADKTDSKKEGKCEASKSEFNADSYSFVAAGIFYTKQCDGRFIPYPDSGGASTVSDSSVAVRRERRNNSRENVRIGRRGFNESIESSSNTGLRLQRRAQTSCSVPDYIVWDKDEDEGLKVTGYAHFGDSYASGMGTGVTSGDKCRIGSNNYGDLLNNFFDDDNVVWPGPLSCSGDTTVELAKRIDGWKTAEDTNVATLTIGGNDVGFSDLVTYCVVIPWPWSNGEKNRKKCIEYEEAALDHMDDESSEGLKAKLTASYLKILQKGYDAHGPGLDLYVTGYPQFFESETDDCKNSTFDYYWSGYKYVHGDNIVMLTQDLRRELNYLVDHLNDAIADAVDDANEAWGSYRTHFVPMAGRFAAGADHRWCATEDVHEPDKTREDTWFFLSGWPDVDSSASAQQDESEALALSDEGKITLPSCDEDSPLNDFAGNDPWDVWKCRWAQVIAEDPDGEVAQRLAKANADLSDGNYQTDDVSWWLPTRQIKTFHPRSRGMNSYKDAIVAALEVDGKL